ncbi:alginate export family protein [Aestuariicella sp. G3-2]|uniref:alginate export family protein n=1 Tax=Pseudomaricurvus albidus TaxID=2842452 RepID=UPI001C0E68FE|nr:alginate export family protein [Aestuariicella albida]MBU3069085.1 alginate export family protein [Aestuariicella albida]
MVIRTVKSLMAGTILSVPVVVPALVASAESAGEVSGKPVITPFNPPWDAPRLLNENLSWGGEYVNQIIRRDKSAQLPAEHLIGQELKLGLAAKPFHRVSGLVTLKWQEAIIIDEPDQASRLGFESAYVSWLNESGDPLLSLGRYYYEDSRGFLFHQSVDGIHAQHHWKTSGWDWQFTAFAGRQGVWKEDFLANQGIDDTSYGFLEWKAHNQQRQASAYMFFRESHNRQNDSPQIFGVRSLGQITNSLDHWLELMVARGESGNESIRAYAMDVGAIWQMSSWASAVVGYAYGSGDKQLDDGIDQRFRQSGLQLNNGWIGRGGAKLKYYGELTKPELSNISLSTLGLRFTPFEKASIELLYHDYRQAQADTQFYGFGLKDSPNGIDKGLGEEWDLVLSYRKIPGWKLELNLAQFRPGKAFGGRSKTLSLIYLETRWRF